MTTCYLNKAMLMHLVLVD